MSLRHFFVCCLALTFIPMASCSKKEVADKPQKPDEGVHELDMSGEAESADQGDARSEQPGGEQQEQEAENKSDAKSESGKQSKVIPAVPLVRPGAQQEIEQQVAGDDPGQEDFAALSKEWQAKTRDWRKSLAAAKSRDERNELAQQNPGPEYAEKFLEFAEKHPGTRSSLQAYSFALVNGKPEIKETAIEKIMALVDKDPESESSANSLLLVATYSTGMTQQDAIGRLLSRIEKDLDSEQSFDLLRQIMNLRTDPKVKADVVELANKIVDEDVTSEKAFHALGLLANSPDGEIAGPALDKLFDHHSDHEAFVALVKGMSRKIAKHNQDFLLKVCEEGMGEPRAQAIITLAQFYGRRDLMAQYYADLPPEQLEGLPKGMVEYLRSEREMGESEQLEEWLTKLESEDDSLVEEASNLLFALQNLSIGKTAPEITAEDLDGTEFNLSDYRGKVVFLDFWGDW